MLFQSDWIHKYIQGNSLNINDLIHGRNVFFLLCSPKKKFNIQSHVITRLLLSSKLKLFQLFVRYIYYYSSRVLFYWIKNITSSSYQLPSFPIQIQLCWTRRLSCQVAIQRQINYGSRGPFLLLSLKLFISKVGNTRIQTNLHVETCMMLFKPCVLCDKYVLSIESQAGWVTFMQNQLITALHEFYTPFSCCSHGEKRKSFNRCSLRNFSVNWLNFRSIYQSNHQFENCVSLKLNAHLGVVMCTTHECT